MSTFIKSVLAASFVLGIFTVASAASPESEREELLQFFAARFPHIPQEEYVLGALMLSTDARAQYDSIMDFPPFQGELERGKTFWETPFGNGRTFASCFDNGGRNAAGNFPYYDESADRVVTFEMAINQCLKKNGEPEFDYSDRNTMGVVTAYSRSLSDGMTMNIKVDSPGALRKYEAGKAFYYRRIGQHNLACASCHVTHAGHYFRDELISPVIGQATHFPVFRGGEFLHTLHMRYQRCMEAVRAAPFAAGSEELNNLEYFHSYLSNGLPLKASVYRK